MSQGLAKAEYIQTKGVVVNNAPNWDFLYQVSTVKDPNCTCGDRVVTPDGRVFRYAKAGTGGVQSEWGAAMPLKTIDVAVAPAQATGAGAVGSQSVTLTVSATSGVAGNGAFALDELRGGYVVIGNGSAQHPQMRCITGNPAKVAGAASLTVTLDAKLTAAVSVGVTTIETMTNPYSDLVPGSGGYQTFLGIPARTATVGQYFWLQTWGPCWITSNSATCNGVGDRTIVFAANGSVVSSDDITVESGLQIAGVAMDASSAGASNAPMVMLQISV